MFKSRLFKIGMTGDISSKIFHAGDERMIVHRQTGNDLRINTVDAASVLKLKNPTVVENSHSIWCRFREVNARSIRDEVPRSLFAGSVPVLRHPNRHIHDVDRVLDSFLQPTRSKIL